MCPLISMGSPRLHGFDTLIKFIIIIMWQCILKYA